MNSFLRFVVAIVAGTIAVAHGGAASAESLVPKAVELGDFGACLWKQAPAASTKLLRTPLASSQERAAAETLARGHNACIHRRVLTGRTGEIRGAVAEAYFASVPDLLDRIGARVAVAPVRAVPVQGRTFLINYATCLVTADPGHTAALLRSSVATPAERTAFLAYDETLKACMPMGAEYPVNLWDLRNQIVAVAYLSLAPYGSK